MAGYAKIARSKASGKGADIGMAAHYECCSQRNFSRNRP